MSEEDVGNRLRTLVKAVSDDLWIAIANYEVYALTAFDASLIQKVNEREVYTAFNVVSAALEASVISTLCRIWDKTGDAARIAEIEKLLRRRPDLAVDNCALRQWLGGIEMVEKSEELQALRAIRNMRLAHTHDPNRPDPRLRSGVRKAVNDDEPHLLEATILVVQQLHGLIGSPDYLDYRAEREAWRGRAESFWKPIGGALA
jgi:AbiU2